VTTMSAAARAAYESLRAAVRRRYPARLRWPEWDDLRPGERDDWEDAVRAALAAEAPDLADQAIGLFLEYRDSHGHDEESARAAAAREVAEGISVTRAEITVQDGAA
jgi:hypothetical protein